MPRLIRAGKRAPGDPRAALFDYVGDRRGPMAALAAPNGHSVMLSVWPDTLLAMLRAGVLTGAALRDAEGLHRGSGSGPEPTRSS